MLRSVPQLALCFASLSLSLSSISNLCDAKGSGSARTDTQFFGPISSHTHLLHSLNIACWIKSCTLRYLFLRAWYTQAQCFFRLPVSSACPPPAQKKKVESQTTLWYSVSQWMLGWLAFGGGHTHCEPIAEVREASHGQRASLKARHCR